ncbi:MAG: ribonuclease P protein component [Anaerolineales bacterium]|nr:ribonuclease P protein component [Anaerolineales bacterium]MCX7608550.1 ribonuclease P protein component [Anaerolineales bacterium]MDW8227066.1 ribonuclease P protein component [Anaerolineales bacterium]
MNRRFRLTRSTDFKRVRRYGKSYAHPLVVLYALRSDQSGVRVAVTAGTKLGKAVQRNRARRLLREAMRHLLPKTAPGYDLILIARKPLVEARFQDALQALITLLKNARLYLNDDRISTE